MDRGILAAKLRRFEETGKMAGEKTDKEAAGRGQFNLRIRRRGKERLRPVFLPAYVNAGLSGFAGPGKSAENILKVKAPLIKSSLICYSEGMNKQQSFIGMEYAQRKRNGRREKFLDAIDAIIPQAAFEETIKPFTPERAARQAAEGYRVYAADVFSASLVQSGRRVP